MLARKSFRSRWLLLLFAALLAVSVFFVACGSDEDAAASSSSSEPSPSSSSSEPSDDSSSSDASQSTSSAPPAPAVELLKGAPYTCFDEARYPANRAPYLVFTDTSFTFTFNTGEVIIGNMTGSWTLSGNTLTLTVEGRDCSDFRGENISELTFTVQDTYNLVYSGEYIGLTHDGDVFQAEGAPEPGSGAEPADGEGAATSTPSAAELQLDTSYTALDEGRYPADRAPRLLFSGSSFAFTFNTGEVVIGNMTGSYALSGSTLTLTVESCDCTDFRGDGLTELVFTVQDGYRLVYNGEYVGLTHEGDVFEVAGAPPPAPEPTSSAADTSSSSSTTSAAE